MSGGSMDYLYSKVEQANFRADTPLRRAFHAHLQLVAEALKAIEWVDSSDSSPGDEDDAIQKCLGKGAGGWCGRIQKQREWAQEEANQLNAAYLAKTRPLVEAVRIATELEHDGSHENVPGFEWVAKWRMDALRKALEEFHGKS